MAHYDIRLRIVCGPKTCAVMAAEFCEFLTIDQERRVWGCCIFGELRESEGGWIERHPQCIAVSEPAQKPQGSG